MSPTLYCPGELALFGTFDLSYAPVLLYYSYIPILLASLVLSLFILFRDKFSLMSRLLFAISAAFSLWVLNIMLQWVTVPAHINYFEWQITPLLEILIPIFSIYFVTVYLEKRDASLPMKSFLSAAAGLIAILLPTTFNAISFDVPNCQANLGPLIYYVYGFEVFSVFFVLYLCAKKYLTSTEPLFRQQIIYLALGVMFFLGIFSVGQLFGELTKIYEINLIGPIGMLLFIGMLSYMIVKFKVFNAKVFATQILVVALLFFTASLLFIQQIDTIHLIVIFTLGLISVFGANLIRSVQREIEQRIKLQEYEENKNQTINTVAHQFNTAITHLMYAAEGLRDGDTSKEECAERVDAGVDYLRRLSKMFLTAAHIREHKLELHPAPLDLNSFFKRLADTVTAATKQYEKQIHFIVSIPNELPTVLLDEDNTFFSIENLLNNAVKYTPDHGDVSFTVEVKDQNLYCTVKDTGRGIPKADKDKMFGQMFRASNTKDIKGNGLGLYNTKAIINLQGGDISFESEGIEGKGTTFFVKLPLKIATKEDLEKQGAEKKTNK